MPILLILFVDIARAIWALRRDAGFVSLAALALVLVVGGTAFYHEVEGFALVDAFYFTVITLTTVGYGDVSPASDGGKIFTSVFVLVGMGILVAFLTTIAAHIRRHSLLRRPLGRLASHHQGGREATQASLREYDLVVIGSDESSRRAALEAARSGLRVVLVEPGNVPHELADGNRRAA